MAPQAVPTADHELDPVRVEPAAAQDVRGEGCAGLDGHRDASLQFVQLDLGRDVSGKDLQVSDEAGGRQAEVLVESVYFFRSLVGNQGPGGRAPVCREHDSI